ncbi:MAG: hypothetical protein BWK76_05390 [Desulfobulbaceae bacterium A2]|nr:MAG: hypothetical protein BWK76_05390 [Desulfobulbaceae bacterium A2]
MQAVVCIVVRQRPSDTRRCIEEWTAENIPASARQHCITLVLAELPCLHEGNIGRYGIRPSEFTAWQEQHQRP